MEFESVSPIANASLHLGGESAARLWCRSHMPQTVPSNPLRQSLISYHAAHRLIKEIMLTKRVHIKSGPMVQQAAFAAAVQERRARVSERGNREHWEYMESVKAAHKFTVAKTVNESRSISGKEAELRRKLGTPGWIPGDAFRVVAEPLKSVKASGVLSVGQIKSLGLLIDPRDLVNHTSVDAEASVRDWLLANGARSVDFVAPSNQSSTVRDKLLKTVGELSTPDFLIDGYLTVGCEGFT